MGSAPEPAPARRLLIFDTHPIQYHAPVFRALARRLPDFQVVFFNETWSGDRWWYQDRSAPGTTPETPGVPLTSGYRHEFLRAGNLGPLGTGRALNALFDRERPDAILIYGYYLPEHWVLRALAQARGVPILFIGDTFSRSPGALRRAVTDPLRRWFFQGVSQFVTVGEKNASYYRGLGIAAERLTRARYCVDIDYFRMAPEAGRTEREQWRHRQQIPADAFVILLAARLVDVKRPHDAVRLLQALQRERRIYLAIAGAGPLEEAIRTAAVGNDRIRFLGFQQQNGMRSAYYGSDLLFLPSERETWGLVVNEAFACGIPALVTEGCGAADDLVERGNTGFVFPTGDIDRAAEYVQRLIDDPALHQRLGESARKKVAEEYSVDRFADAIVGAFERSGGK